MCFLKPSVAIHDATLQYFTRSETAIASNNLTICSNQQLPRNKVILMQAKQTSMEDLTAGQAAQLARNEQIIDKATEEHEDLEEVLNDSIAASLKGKRGKVEAEDTTLKRK